MPPILNRADFALRSRITPHHILHQEGTDREVEVGGVEGEGHNEHLEQWVPMHHECAHRRAPRERGKGRHTLSKPVAQHPGEIQIARKIEMNTFIL